MILSDSLKKILGQELMENVPLAPLSTMGVGGCAELYFEPRKLEDLVLAKKLCDETATNFRIIGGGSNIIVDDSGLSGLVISTRALNKIRLYPARGGTVSVVADSGVKLGKIVGTALKESLTGMEFAVGIPGTIGGALFGNAGTMGCSISDVVDWIDIVDMDGNIVRKYSRQLKWGYRRSEFSAMKECIIAGAKLRLSTAPKEDIVALSRLFEQKRINQPYKDKSAGCVFKNPDGDSAGRLLEEAGCKGMKKGNAEISDVHANFIINLGGATFHDIMWLIAMCKDRVRDRFGVTLSTEVRIFSDALSEI